MGAREALVKAIADAKAKVVEVEESTVFGQKYKDEEIERQRNFIIQQEDQLAGFDEMMKRLTGVQPS
jgi:hypothetical protein